MISNIFAHFISIILGPFVWGPILIILIILHTNLSTSQIHILLPFLLIFQVGIPLLLLLFSYKFKKISDLDLSKREERIIPIIIIFVSLLISVLIIKLYGSLTLLRIYLFFILFLSINGLITLFWKISFHMAINVAGSLFINFLYDWKFPILYLSIPLIYWSRLKLKKHTRAQLIAALIVNSLMIFLFLKGFRYL